MKQILLIALICSFSYSINIYQSLSISQGKSESLGKYGGLDLKINVGDYFFLNVGTSFIVQGGIGAGIRYSYKFHRVSPFISSTMFGSYNFLPFVEGSADYDIHSIGAIGLDVHAIKIYNVNINFQFGIMRYLYTETLTRPPASQAFNIPNPNDNRGFFNLKMTMPNK